MAGLDVAVDEERLAGWLVERRWFATKARDVAQIRVVDALQLHDGPPRIALGLVEARFPAGTHDVYQLLLLRDGDGEWRYDAFDDPQACALVGELLGGTATVDSEHARVDFRWEGAVPAPSAGTPARPAGAEQSNSSVIYGDEVILKAFRRLEPGENPELEMLRFLSARGFPYIAELGGWYQYDGELMGTTLGVAQRFVPGGRDGWELTLDELGRDPEGLLERLGDLGGVIGAMHSALGSDLSDPAFAPEEPSQESTALIVAALDEEIDRVFFSLRDDPALEPIAGRGEEVRDRLQLLSHVGAGGKVIRHHGDLHLGQTLLAPEGWFVLDFEGEPARPLPERRRKRSPLRDVAGMLRSFAYAASALELQRGTAAPEGWEGRARDSFLEGYWAEVDAALLPPGQGASHTLLSIFELEKAVYELRYELNNRPDWVRIPVAGIARLLEEPVL